MHLVNSFFSLY